MVTMSKKKTGLGLSAAAIIAVSFIQPWEGRRYEPYLDVGGVLTVCDGHTGPDIVAGKIYTDVECDFLTAKDVNTAEVGVNKYLKAPVSDKTKAAFISFAYNAGVPAFGSSTLLRLANAGDVEGACNQLSRWVFVKGVRIKGLVNRRMSERALCLDGLQKNPWWGV